MLKSLAKGPLFGALGGALFALLGYLAPIIGGKSLNKYSSDFTYLTLGGAGVGVLMILLSMILGRRAADQDDEEEVTSPWSTAKDELEHLSNLIDGEDTPTLSKKEQKEKNKKEKETEKFNKQAEKEAAKAAKQGRKKGKGQEETLEDDEPITFTAFPSMRKNVDPNEFNSNPLDFPDPSKGFVGNRSDFPSAPGGTPPVSSSDFPEALRDVAPAFAPALFDPESEPDWFKDAFEDGSLAYPYGDNNAPKTIPLPGETEIVEVEVSKNSTANLNKEHDGDSSPSSDKKDEGNSGTEGSQDGHTGDENADGSAPKVVQNFFLPNGDLDIDKLEELGDVSAWNTDKKDGASTGASEELSDKENGHSFPGGVSTHSDSHSDKEHGGDSHSDDGENGKTRTNNKYANNNSNPYSGTIMDDEGNIYSGALVDAQGDNLATQSFETEIDSRGNVISKGYVRDADGNVHTGEVVSSEENPNFTAPVGNRPSVGSTLSDPAMNAGTVRDTEGNLHSGVPVDGNGMPDGGASFGNGVDNKGNMNAGTVRDAEGNLHSGEVVSSEGSAPVGRNRESNSAMNAGKVQDAEGNLHSGVPVDGNGMPDGGASFGNGVDSKGNINPGTIRDGQSNLHSGEVVAPLFGTPAGDTAPVSYDSGEGSGYNSEAVASVREPDGTVHSGKNVGATGSLPLGTVQDSEGNTHSGLIVDENGNIPSDSTVAGEVSSNFEAGFDASGNARVGSVRDESGNLHSGVIMGSEGSVRTGTIRDESGIFRSGVVLDAAGKELKVNSVYPQRSANGSDEFEIIDDSGESRDSKVADQYSSEGGEVFTPTSAELEEAHRLSIGAGVKTVGDFVVVEGAAGTAKVSGSDENVGTGSDDIASLNFDHLNPPPYRHEEEKAEELFDIPAKEKEGITVVLDRESFEMGAEDEAADEIHTTKRSLTTGSDLDVLSHDIQEIVKRVIEETRIGQRKANTAQLEEENARLIQEVLDKDTKLSEQLAEQERLQTEKDIWTAKELEDKDAEIARLRVANKKMSNTLGELEELNQDLQSAQNTVASVSARSERIKISHKINQFKESLIEESADPKSIGVLDVLIEDLSGN